MNAQKILALIQKSREGKGFLNKLTNVEVKALQSLIKKFLRGKIKVDSKKMKQMERYKSRMRKIARINTKNVKGTRRALRQAGYGLFSILLPAALSLITGLISRKKK